LHAAPRLHWPFWKSKHGLSTCAKRQLAPRVHWPFWKSKQACEREAKVEALADTQEPEIAYGTIASELGAKC
jgi:hypothetical protein